MPSRDWYSRLAFSRARTRLVASTSMWTYAWGTASARVICAAIPFRIFVIGRRTSSAPSGKRIGSPAGAVGDGGGGEAGALAAAAGAGALAAAAGAGAPVAGEA